MIRKKTLSFLILLFIISFFPSLIFAQEIPAQNHPDINALAVRGYKAIDGALRLVDYGGETDYQAPQLTTLIGGVSYPPIVSLYQVYNWDWSTNSRGALLSKWGATLIGLGNSAGQEVLVPYSGYDIGGGYQAVVLYASTNSLTIHYGIEDSVASGYTIHLENLTVNPEILSLYQKLDSQGREELPAVSGGFLLGKTTGGELRVAIRDTGEFMDPRSRKDWWHGNVAKPPPLPLSTTKVVKTLGGAVPKPFISTRQVETTDIASSLADPVIFRQSGSLPVGQKEKEIVRAGFFEKFKDLSLPFVQDLTRYLAGPFVYQGNTAIFNFLQLNRPDQAGVLTKLTSLDLQDQLRRDYWQKCKDGTYCSSQNIGSKNCPNPSSNECLIADGREIQNLVPPPDPKEAIYQNNKDQYLKDYSSWQKNWRKVWVQVPLFSNPKTVVKNAIRMNACNATSDTTVETKTPWVSALNEISGFLASLLLPSVLGEVQGAKVQGDKIQEVQTQGTQVQVAQVQGEKTYLAQGATLGTVPPGCKYYYGDGPRGDDCSCMAKGTCRAEHSGPQGCCPPHAASWGVICGWDDCRTGERAKCDPNQVCYAYVYGGGGITPPPPVCTVPNMPNSKPGGLAEKVEVEGHANLVGPSEKLNCKEWIGSGCSEGRTQATIEDPVWPTVNFPFLNTIYENLAGEKGIFRTIFKPNDIEVNDWQLAGESGLNYCFKPVQAYSGVESLWADPKFLGGGGLYPYKVDFKPKALCDNESTQNLRVFPEKIGGVKNAQEWVSQEFLLP